jgi:glycosyltransferase involved in cell wall biosynthesis
MAAGLAVISTAMGNIPEMLRDSDLQAGVALDYTHHSDLEERLVEEMSRLMRENHLLETRRSHARRIFEKKYNINSIAREISQLFVAPATKSANNPSPSFFTRTEPAKPLVSVILPNYNHAPYLNERLQSILNQGIEDMEIILMDDCSRDASPRILADFCRWHSNARLLANSTNSGSTFKQWRKGLSEARGKYIWIAESDDSAEHDLLRTLLSMHEENPDTILCYAQSMMIDLSSRAFQPAYFWTDEIDTEKWKRDYVNDGLEELRMAISVKNTIPNVSAVLFRNTPALTSAIEESMRLCADWLAYVRLCAHGKIGYCHRPLNRWRLSSSNARTKPPGELEWLEGSRVYSKIGHLLRWAEPELSRRREQFREKCISWNQAA